MRVRILPLALLLGGAWVFAQVRFLTTSLLVLVDSLAHAAQWVGVSDPGLAWLLLGVVAGALVGALVGMRRAGRPVPRSLARGAATVAGVGLLVAGSYAPARAAAGWGRATRAERVDPPYPTTTSRPRSAARPRRPTVAPAQPAYSAGGEVESGSDLAPGAAPRSGGIAPAPPAEAAPPAAAPSVRQPPTVSAGAPDAADRASVADVRAQLAAARAGARGGDYAAALRALAGADEGVTLAADRYGEQPWVSALRREAAGARATVQSLCESAAAQAGSRGETPPHCD